MNDPRCVICKHLDAQNASKLNASHVFTEEGAKIKVLLCRHHEVELFTLGQKKFFLTYNKILLDVLNSEEVEFLRLLERTVRKHYEEIY